MTKDRKKQEYTDPTVEWIDFSREDIMNTSVGEDNDNNQGPWSSMNIGIDPADRM